MKRKLFIPIMLGSLLLGCSYKDPVFTLQMNGENEEETEVTDEEDDENETNPDSEDVDIDLSEWNLIWSEEFNEDVYNGATQEENRKILDNRWFIQNEPSTHIICGRYRENVEVSDGTLKLINKKEFKNGQDWTSGNIWTKEHFMYGYYECRYKYAAANATNNSFWIMSQNSGQQPAEGFNFEIDINEGHFPSEIATNIHKYSTEHTTSSKKYIFGIQPGYSIEMENPITARKLRFYSTHPKHFHIREFRVFNYIKDYTYPDPLKAYDKNTLTNYALSSTVKASGTYMDKYPPKDAIDNSNTTSWCAQEDGEKWLEIDLGSDISIGCIQFVNGWQSGSAWMDLITNYKIQYEKDGEWIDISSADETTLRNFAEDYHTYGLEWTRDELIFYFDRKEIRREKNEFCYSAAPVWLSLAIITWSGPVTDAIDGTKMEVDYVRIYERK